MEWRNHEVCDKMIVTDEDYVRRFLNQLRLRFARVNDDVQVTVLVDMSRNYSRNISTSAITINENS